MNIDPNDTILFLGWASYLGIKNSRVLLLGIEKIA